MRTGGSSWASNGWELEDKYPCLLALAVLFTISLSSLVICWVMYPHSLPSHPFFTPLLGLPGITSYINDLHSNLQLCWRVCFWVNTPWWAHQCNLVLFGARAAEMRKACSRKAHYLIGKVFFFFFFSQYKKTKQNKTYCSQQWPKYVWRGKETAASFNRRVRKSPLGDFSTTPQGHRAPYRSQQVICAPFAVWSMLTSLQASALNSDIHCEAFLLIRHIGQEERDFYFLQRETILVFS